MDEADPASPPPRWRRRKEARPNEITDAALAVFAERGFAAARLEEVAARAGVTKGTLYLYFSSKEELFKAVVRSAIVANLEAAERGVAAHEGSAMDGLERFLSGIARRVFTSAAGVIPKLIIAEAGNFPDLARFYRDEVIDRALGMLAGVLERGVARGEFRAMDTAATARLVVAPMLMIVLWRHTFAPIDDRPWDVDAMMRCHLDHLRRALCLGGDDL